MIWLTVSGKCFHVLQNFLRPYWFIFPSLTPELGTHHFRASTNVLTYCTLGAEGPHSLNSEMSSLEGAPRVSWQLLRKEENTLKDPSFSRQMLIAYVYMLIHSFFIFFIHYVFLPPTLNSNHFHIQSKDSFELLFVSRHPDSLLYLTSSCILESFAPLLQHKEWLMLCAHM